MAQLTAMYLGRKAARSAPLALVSMDNCSRNGEKRADMKLGGEINSEQIKTILAEAAIWGVDLNECGLAGKVAGYFRELMAGPGAVRATLKKYVH